MTSRIFALVISVLLVMTTLVTPDTYAASFRAPSRVAGLSAEALSTTSIRVSWKKASRASRYQLGWRRSGSKRWHYRTLRSSARRSTVKGLRASASGTKYYFRVRAQRRCHGRYRSGKWSAVISERTAKKTSAAPSQSDSRVLVVYFSATGNTRRVAEVISDELSADTFVIAPSDPYTSSDLDWTDSDSRVNREHEDESLQNVALSKTTPENWADYDTVFIGYPIWWGGAAWPVSSFVRANDFSGKTVIPFCTSSSSPIGSSGSDLAETAGTGNWQEGRRFSSGASSSAIREWARSVVE
jgi:flavodoxin